MISIDKQIEVCEYAADYCCTGLPTAAKKLRAAAETLRRVRACRELADQKIADGVIVAADIEGLIA